MAIRTLDRHIRVWIRDGSRSTIAGMERALPFESGIRTKMAMRVARRKAEEQSWAIARWQMLAAGITLSRINRLVAAGWLYIQLPGVYSWGRPKGEHIAALLFTGTGSALTGLTGLWWEGLLPFRPAAIHIDAPGRSRSRPGLVIRHPSSITRHEHRGLPVVDLATALLVASEELDHNGLRNALARADFEDLLSLSSLQVSCAKGLKGSKALRAAMDSHLPQLARCVNDFERDFVLLCEAHELPIPDPNVRMGRYVPDMLWRERKVIVELDGKGAHTSAAQKRSDATKQEWLEARGYTVIRFTWGQVYLRRRFVAATVRAALAQPRKSS